MPIPGVSGVSFEMFVHVLANVVPEHVGLEGQIGGFLAGVFGFDGVGEEAGIDEDVEFGGMDGGVGEGSGDAQIGDEIGVAFVEKIVTELEDVEGEAADGEGGADGGDDGGEVVGGGGAFVGRGFEGGGEGGVGGHVLADEVLHEAGGFAEFLDGLGDFGAMDLELGFSKSVLEGHFAEGGGHGAGEGGDGAAAGGGGFGGGGGEEAADGGIEDVVGLFGHAGDSQKGS